MRTAADDLAWVERLQATTERLKQREAAAQAEAGAQEAIGSGPAAQGSGPPEAAAPSTGGAEPGSTSTAQASVEATEAEASARDAGRADVEEVVVQVPPEAGQEATQPEELQSRQDPPTEPAVEVEGGAVAPPPVVPVVAPAIEAVVDLTLDDSPIDKGKQVVGVEEVEAVDQAGPSAAVKGAEAADQAGPSVAPESARSGRRPDGRTLSGWPWYASNPGAEPVFALNDRDEVHH
jgi:hypothetical protein